MLLLFAPIRAFGKPFMLVPIEELSVLNNQGFYLSPPSQDFTNVERLEEDFTAQLACTLDLSSRPSPGCQREMGLSTALLHKFLEEIRPTHIRHLHIRNNDISTKNAYWAWTLLGHVEPAEARIGE